MSTTKDYDHLLIDGKNALYRAIFAGYRDAAFRAKGHDYFAIMVKFLHKYLDSFKPKNMHIFWDSSPSWRHEIMPTYKGHRKGMYADYEIDVRKELKRQTHICVNILKNMGLRQYFRESQEADDLIYAFCRSTLGERVLIISSDADFKQISYQYGTIDIHNPMNRYKKRIEDVPRHDPVLAKAFAGDKSDNIAGYYGVGKVKSQSLVVDLVRRKEFFKSDRAKVMNEGVAEIVGSTLFRRNRALIDMSLCPHLLDNMMYVEGKLTSKTIFEYSKVVESLRKNKVNGVVMEGNQYIKPFKRLVSKSG